MFNRIFRYVGQFTTIAIFALTLAGPLTAQAQNRAQKSIISQLLWQTILQCYEVPQERTSADDEVILRVELDMTGDIADLPDLIEPAKLSDGERAMMREAIVALIDCTPINSGGGEKSIYGTFDIVVNKEGLALTNVDAYVGLVTTIPTLDSLEVDVVPVATEEPVQTAVLEEINPIAKAPEIKPVANNTEIGTQETEAALGLTRNDRKEIQRRLVLLDYDTRGVDGVFGGGSRSAIQKWQRDNGIIISGYLNFNQLAILREMSQVLYAEWDSRPKRYVDRNGCLREPNGVIVKNRSFKCDLAAASQNLGLSN